MQIAVYDDQTPLGMWVKLSVIFSLRSHLVSRF